MNDIIQPEAWSDFWLIAFLYLPFGFGMAVFLAILGSVLIAAVSASTGMESRIEGRIVNLFGFLSILIPVSAIFSALWCCTVAGRMYITNDVDSPDDDFTVFIPINSCSISAEHGRLLTSTIHDLQLMWLGYAALAWAISFLIYRIIRQVAKLGQRQVNEDENPAPRMPLASPTL